MVKLKNNSKIYILCPGESLSGGPEALHQLGYYLNKMGYNAYLCYYHKFTTNPRYTIYRPQILPIESIEDDCNNVIITPESSTKLLRKYTHSKKCIWWLGIQHYDGFETFPIGVKAILKQKWRIHTPVPFWKIRQLLLKIISKRRFQSDSFIPDNKVTHLCGSEFAYAYVKKTFKIPYYLVEPLSLPFLERKDNPILKKEERSKTILYNPSKPSIIMNKLLKRKDLKFTPLENMDILQMQILFRKSLLYIDFGFFGGPERIPKEAVYNGTLLLVARRNAAVNSHDVPIPEQFKIEDFNNETVIVEKIKYMLDNYTELITLFGPFREKILNLEANFQRQIKNIFIIE
ncbi:hypothetical protein KO02_19700 [Sphingobacterium sp. ML3W]|uniref:hypothetical protein n=1 Tax=Sphingobacterium sp. ML3W TaxID=1538644 RepID=UPI0004F77591|nr:hypothetical protein [Sphingobacterium sp. ML3W]AIM38672.1 hypothetical protein KO02_19700 [Sphingobacterium sp. ML3W]